MVMVNSVFSVFSRFCFASWPFLVGEYTCLCLNASAVHDFLGDAGGELTFDSVKLDDSTVLGGVEGLIGGARLDDWVVLGDGTALFRLLRVGGICNAGDSHKFKARLRREIGFV